MDQLNVFYNHQIRAGAINPHQRQFTIEISETPVTQTFYKTMTGCHNLSVLPVLLVINMHICTLSCMQLGKNSIIVSDTALTLPFSILTLLSLFPVRVSL